MPVDCRLALSFGDYGGEHGKESEEGKEGEEDSKKEKEVTVRPRSTPTCFLEGIMLWSDFRETAARRSFFFGGPTSKTRIDVAFGTFRT